MRSNCAPLSLSLEPCCSKRISRCPVEDFLIAGGLHWAVVDIDVQINRCNVSDLVTRSEVWNCLGIYSCIASELFAIFYIKFGSLTWSPLQLVILWPSPINLQNLSVLCIRICTSHPAVVSNLPCLTCCLHFFPNHIWLSYQLPCFFKCIRHLRLPCTDAFDIFICKSFSFKTPLEYLSGMVKPLASMTNPRQWKS